MSASSKNLSNNNVVSARNHEQVEQQQVNPFKELTHESNNVQKVMTPTNDQGEELFKNKALQLDANAVHPMQITN